MILTFAFVILRGEKEIKTILKGDPQTVRKVFLGWCNSLSGSIPFSMTRHIDTVADEERLWSNFTRELESRGEGDLAREKDAIWVQGTSGVWARFQGERTPELKEHITQFLTVEGTLMQAMAPRHGA